MASLIFSSEVVSFFVRRGDLEMKDASALYDSAKKNVRSLSSLYQGDPEVIKLASNILELMAQMTDAYSAEKPGPGAN